MISCPLPCSRCLIIAGRETRHILLREGSALTYVVPARDSARFVIVQIGLQGLNRLLNHSGAVGEPYNFFIADVYDSWSGQSVAHFSREPRGKSSVSFSPAGVSLHRKKTAKSA